MAPSVMSGMGSMENPSPKAVSQSTEDWEAVTWASETLDEGPEGDEVSLDDLADCIHKSLKPFAQRIIQVLEKCQERTCRESFSEACAQLKDVCQSCDQQDRLIIAGSGNVGKSTIANALLGGGKFWPTASVCMTSRICEARYNADSDGQPISKQMVQKGVTSESEECHRIQEPLRVFHPSPLLKPDVILVDLPGLDQEREYMDRLEEYMKCHSDASVALLYVIDVKNKICNPDRHFFEKLMTSPWKNLSQSLGLLVNKCDMGGDENGASSEEEAPDYAKLLADITKETQNYCTPKVMDLSMKDKKKDHPEAKVKWQEVDAYAHNAVAQLKSRRLINILLSLEKVMDMLWLAVQDDQHLRAELDKRENHLSKAEAKVKELADSRDEWVIRRAIEINRTLKQRQDGHFDAILSAGVPHYMHEVDAAYLEEVDKKICHYMRTMVANDIQLSAMSSKALAMSSEEHMKEFGSKKQRLREKYGVIVAEFASPVLSTVAYVIYAVDGLLAYVLTLLQTTLVDESYVKQRFTAIYEQVIQQIPSKHDAAMVDQAMKDLQEKQLCLQCLREEAGSRGFLNDEFKADCSELQERFASLSTRSKMMQADA